MPPKKKGSGKKKKGKKSGKKSPPKPMPATEQLSESSKDFYLVQMKDLENRLSRYQLRCDELAVTHGRFKDDYDQMAVDKKEIVAFLKKSLGQRSDEISDLQDRLTGLQQVKDSERETFEQQLQQIRTEFQEMKDQLTSENMILAEEIEDLCERLLGLDQAKDLAANEYEQQLHQIRLDYQETVDALTSKNLILGGKLASLEEFKVQKEDLMAKMEALKDALEAKEKEHEDKMYILERKQVVDKDRLKKEMVMRVNQVAAEFRKVSNKQMAETTKRTIRENVSINSQLAKMSDKTVDIIQENDELTAKVKKLKQQLDMLEANEKELAKKNNSNQKIIRLLTDKCKRQEEILMALEEREAQYQNLEEESEQLKKELGETREENQDVSKENEQLREELDKTKSDLKEECRNKLKLEGVLAEASQALAAALRTTGAEDIGDSPNDVIEKRDNMLENLLILLNSAAAIGVGPAPGELGRQTETKLVQSKQMPGSGKGLRKGDIPMSPIARVPGGGNVAHYQLGDLGLIPRPNQHILTNYERMNELSATTRLGTLKKVRTRSIGIQTFSSPKAMFFADHLMAKIPVDTRSQAGTGTDDRASSLSQITVAKKMPNKVF